jgi:hypothetical protein
MALDVGDSGATAGMTKDIYEKLNELLMPSVPPEGLGDAQKVWKQLAFAIATGVVGHVLANLEVRNVTVAGNVTLPVSGANAAGSVTLAQNATTTGLIR